MRSSTLVAKALESGNRPTGELSSNKTSNSLEFNHEIGEGHFFKKFGSGRVLPLKVVVASWGKLQVYPPYLAERTDLPEVLEQK